MSTPLLSQRRPLSIECDAVKTDADVLQMQAVLDALLDYK
jgi:hypothetical protein